MTTENIGDIVISPRVLEVITGIAATKVDGVHSLRNKAMTDSFSKTVLGKGVYLQTEEDGTVNADIYVYLQYVLMFLLSQSQFNKLLKLRFMTWQK